MSKNTCSKMLLQKILVQKDSSEPNRSADPNISADETSCKKSLNVQ